jgi:transposase InsO family protein
VVVIETTRPRLRAAITASVTCPGSAIGRFEADLPNQLWQTDFTHTPLADGGDVEVLTFLDDHSRYALSVTAHRPVTVRAVLTACEKAVARHGIPAARWRTPDTPPRCRTRSPLARFAHGSARYRHSA